MVKGPVRVRVRMYQVGFGDCFLVSLEYAAPLADGRAERHILIDCGTTSAPREDRTRGRMPQVAALIAAHTGGVLDVLVVSHRHEDHVAGFADDAGAATLRALAPKRVLRPWTDAPSLRSRAGDGGDAASGVDEEAVTLARLLSAAQHEAAALAMLPALHIDVRREARSQVENAKADAVLDALGAEDRVRYLAADGDAELRTIVPGLTARVLGPFTPAQRPRRGTAESDTTVRAAALHASLREAANSHPDADERREPMRLGPGPVRWLVDRIAAQRSHSVARLVRDLDEAINDTSLVLLLEIGGISMLFAGDAQVEGWQPILEKAGRDADLGAALANIDLYKVGHHGSRNATPRSLHALWRERDDDERPMTALLSTRAGVHGSNEATAVPRTTLVAALRDVATVYSTDDLGEDEDFVELVADAARGPFRRVEA